MPSYSFLLSVFGSEEEKSIIIAKWTTPIKKVVRDEIKSIDNKRVKTISFLDHGKVQVKIDTDEDEIEYFQSMIESFDDDGNYPVLLNGKKTLLSAKVIKITKTMNASSKKKQVISKSKKSSSSKKKTKTTKKSIPARLLNRPSPPYPAKEFANRSKAGNDGNRWRSKPNVNGVYRWVKI
jgi:hypothetical protein